MKLKAPMMEETVARYADGMDMDRAETIKDLLKKKERVKRMCDKVGRGFKELKWSVSKTVGVIGEDTDDFEERLKEITEQEWIWARAGEPESVKQKYLETLNSKEIGGTPPVVIEKLSEFKDHADIMNICLPYVGNLRKNGLDTIKILKERILGVL
jgi:alkanesulfonate monooxygenase SsuD/methylene tetrahydromethanopterin reductase-like flavin-dependent oxidoreductase (luciferase family)